LERYTHRTAISNDRILEVNDQKVVFSWNDYNKDYKKQISSRKGEDFLRLFCQHILPPRFTRIKHYGFLSSASKRKSLAIIRHDLRVTSPSKTTTLTWRSFSSTHSTTCSFFYGIFSPSLLLAIAKLTA